MSAPVSNDFESIKKRLGYIKIICLLICFLAFIVAVTFDASIYDKFAVLGLCGAIFALSTRVFQLWRSKHENADIFKYEAHLYGLVAIGFLITYIVFLSTGYYYYIDRATTMLLGFIAFTLLAIEARLSLFMHRQNADIADIGILDISKQAQFA